MKKCIHYPDPIFLDIFCQFNCAYCLSAWSFSVDNFFTKYSTEFPVYCVHICFLKGFLIACFAGVCFSWLIRRFFTALNQFLNNRILSTIARFVRRIFSGSFAEFLDECAEKFWKYLLKLLRLFFVKFVHNYFEWIFRNNLLSTYHLFLCTKLALCYTTYFSFFLWNKSRMCRGRIYILPVHFWIEFTNFAFSFCIYRVPTFDFVNY